MRRPIGHVAYIRIYRWLDRSRTLCKGHYRLTLEELLVLFTLDLLTPCRRLYSHSLRIFPSSFFLGFNPSRVLLPGLEIVRPISQS
jgi:hypothetical protein